MGNKKALYFLRKAQGLYKRNSPGKCIIRFTGITASDSILEVGCKIHLWQVFWLVRSFYLSGLPVFLTVALIGLSSLTYSGGSATDFNRLPNYGLTWPPKLFRYSLVCKEYISGIWIVNVQNSK